jgi:membrane-associated phospholipid phosphatase
MRTPWPSHPEAVTAMHLWPGSRSASSYTRAMTRRPRTPLLARRRVIGGVIAAAVMATVVLGVRYAGTHQAGRLDLAIDRRLSYRLAGRRGVLQHLVDLADPVTVAVICALMCALFLALGRRRVAALAVLGPATAGALVDLVLKPLFDRRFHGMLSFPSGHTAAAVAMAIVVIVAVVGPSRPPWPAPLRWLTAAAAAAGAAAIATALVGAEYHYATDTVGGLSAAVASVLCVALAIDAVADRELPWPRRGGQQPASVDRSRPLPRVEA